MGKHDGHRIIVNGHGNRWCNDCEEWVFYSANGGWRLLNQSQRTEIAGEISMQAMNRYEEGAREHGELFTDDPLDQLETELLDALFYVKMARRQRESLTDG